MRVPLVAVSIEDGAKRSRGLCLLMNRLGTVDDASNWSSSWNIPPLNLLPAEVVCSIRILSSSSVRVYVLSLDAWKSVRVGAAATRFVDDEE